MISKVLFWGNVLQKYLQMYRAIDRAFGLNVPNLSLLSADNGRMSRTFIQAAENLSIQHCLSVD